MKKTFSVCLLLIIFFSCSKTDDNKPGISKVDLSYCMPIDPIGCSGTLCQSDTCQTYFAIWKEQFLTRNQMSQDYFNNHITPCKTQLFSWVDGISFEISYKVEIDWAETVLSDKFAIWLSKTTLGLYPSLDVPRNILLSADQINVLYIIQAFSSSINSVSSVNQLKYTSFREAMSALIKESKVDTLCTGNVFFQSPNFTSPPSGNPYLEASGVLNWNENKCITSSLDLVTGKAQVFYNVCIINL
jgi:hypothetical protein